MTQILIYQNDKATQLIYAQTCKKWLKKSIKIIPIQRNF